MPYHLTKTPTNWTSQRTYRKGFGDGILELQTPVIRAGRTIVAHPASSNQDVEDIVRSQAINGRTPNTYRRRRRGETSEQPQSERDLQIDQLRWFSDEFQRRGQRNDLEPELPLLHTVARSSKPFYIQCSSALLYDHLASVSTSDT